MKKYTMNLQIDLKNKLKLLNVIKLRIQWLLKK